MCLICNLILKIQAGMSFNSHDSDDADSDQGTRSDNGTQDDGSTEFILPNHSGTWEMKKVNTVWVGGVLIVLTVSIHKGIILSK